MQACVSMYAERHVLDRQRNTCALKHACCRCYCACLLLQRKGGCNCTAFHHEKGTQAKSVHAAFTYFWTLLPAHCGDASTQRRNNRSQGCLYTHTLRPSPMLCRSCHRKKSILPGWVAYLKRPPTFIVSWLPLRMCNAPPAAAASFCSLSRKYNIWTSLSPLSSWSPTCNKYCLLSDACEPATQSQQDQHV